MSELVTLESPGYSAFPKVGLEMIEVTPEQHRSPFPDHLIGKTRRIEGINSWVKGIVDLLIVYFSDTDGLFVQTGGLSRTADASHSPKLSFLFGNSGVGVLVGTGLTAIDRDDFTMDVRIAEGTGADQLTHAVPGAVTKTATVTGGHRIMLERSFTNNSGGTITITEVGVVVATREVGSTTISPMILHDLISPGHAVVNGGAVIVRYLLDWLA